MKNELINRNELAVNNLGLVHSCAGRFRGRGVEYEDLFQAGCLGLVKASKNFDPDKGFSFSTYAVYVILGEIRKIFREGGSVKLGRSLKEQTRKVMQIKNELTVTLGREPTLFEISEANNCDPAEAAALLNAFRPVISINSDEFESGETEIPVESHEESVSDNIALRQIIDQLSDDDRKLIELRYYKGMTQTAAAGKLGISQVQVSRKEKKILSELRKKLTT